MLGRMSVSQKKVIAAYEARQLKQYVVSVIMSFQKTGTSWQLLLTSEESEFGSSSYFFGGTVKPI